MKILTKHEHATAAEATSHCWTLVQGGWQARTVTRDGHHFVEVGAWAGFNGTDQRAAG